MTFIEFYLMKMRKKRTYKSMNKDKWLDLFLLSIQVLMMILDIPIYNFRKIKIYIKYVAEMEVQVFLKNLIIILWEVIWYINL